MRLLTLLILGFAACRAAPTCESGRQKGRFAFNAGGGAAPSLHFGGENAAYFVGGAGEVYTTEAKIGTSPKCNKAALFQSERFTRDERLVYKLPMPAGVYTVTTMHAEIYHQAAGKRLFHIDINGKRKRTNLDVFKDANGMNKAIKLKHHNIRSVDGFVTLELVRSVENPQISGVLVEGPGADSIAVACCGAKCAKPPIQNTSMSEATETTPDVVIDPVVVGTPMAKAEMASPEPSIPPMSPDMPLPTAMPLPSLDSSPMSNMDMAPPAEVPPMPSTSASASTERMSPSAMPTTIVESMPSAKPMPSTEASPMPTATATSTPMASPAASEEGKMEAPVKASGGCKGSYIFCEDFEGAKGTWTLENAATIGLAPPRAGKRSKALHLTPEGGRNGRLVTDLQGADTPVLHGRLRIYATKYATGPPFAHFVAAELWQDGAAGTERVRPVGGQYVLVNGTEKRSVWGVGSDGGPTGDWTQWRFAEPTEDATWTCIEWKMVHKTSRIDVWLDGRLRPELAVDRAQHDGGHGDFVFPKFNKAWFGWWVFQGDTTPKKFDVFIDDIALATERIGC